MTALTDAQLDAIQARLEAASMADENGMTDATWELLVDRIATEDAPRLLAALRSERAERERLAEALEVATTALGELAKAASVAADDWEDAGAEYAMMMDFVDLRVDGEKALARIAALQAQEATP